MKPEFFIFVWVEADPKHSRDVVDVQCVRPAAACCFWGWPASLRFHSCSWPKVSRLMANHHHDRCELTLTVFESELILILLGIYDTF